MEKEIMYIVEEAFSGMRTDKFLSLNVQRFSREKLKECFEKKNCLVNGKAVKPSFKLKEGDEIRTILPEDIQISVEAQNIPIEIVYEDEDVIVVNKPKGMVVHPSPGNYGGTLVNALLYHCEFLSAINGVFRPGIVHRIDKDTSGLLVVCKNDASHKFLAKQFEDHSIKREYRAILHGVPEGKNFTIKGNIARDERDRLKMTVDNTRGKSAVTHGKVLENLGEYSYCAFVLETGRTHQIRVHCSFIFHPIVGDKVYGKNTKVDNKYAGQLLHAMKLGFIHPNGEYIEFASPLPKEFEDFVEVK